MRLFPTALLFFFAITAVSSAWILLPDSQSIPLASQPIESIALEVNKPQIPAYLAFVQYGGWPQDVRRKMRGTQNLTYMILGFNLTKGEKVHWAIKLTGVTQGLRLSLGRGSGRTKNQVTIRDAQMGDEVVTNSDFEGNTTTDSKHGYVIRGTAVGPMNGYNQNASLIDDSDLNDADFIPLEINWVGPEVLAANGVRASVYGPIIETSRSPKTQNAIEASLERADVPFGAYEATPFRAQELVVQLSHAYRIDMGATDPNYPGAFLWDNHASGALTATAASGVDPQVEQDETDRTFWAGIAIGIGVAFFVASIQALPEGSLSSLRRAFLGSYLCRSLSSMRLALSVASSADRESGSQAGRFS